MKGSPSPGTLVRKEMCCVTIGNHQMATFILLFLLHSITMSEKQIGMDPNPI